MRLIAIIVSLALLMLMPCIAISDNTEPFDYLGTNEKYGDIMEGIYNDIASSHNVSFLEVDCFFWEDYVSFSVVVDNPTYAADASIAAFYTYKFFYNSTRWPPKAEIYIKEPNGEHICSSVVYSKWIEYYEAEATINESTAMDNLFKKFAHSAR